MKKYPGDMRVGTGERPSIYDYQQLIYETFKEYAEMYGGRPPTLEEIMRKYSTLEKAESKAREIMMTEPMGLGRKRKKIKSKAKRKSCRCK